VRDGGQSRGDESVSGKAGSGVGGKIGTHVRTGFLGF
jgi:hypothetical protein